jgi:trimethyllysine dioxygenase
MQRTYGFVFVDGVPFSDASFTCRLLNRIGPIRETHYGGFYDFTADLAKADTAYTNLALPPHTDTTYFSEPAGLQAFHLLEHERSPGDTSKQPLGGLTLLIDGFHAADVLRRTNPEVAHILSVYRLPWHASGNEGISITPDELYPVFEHSREQGELVRVRWNNDDRGVVPFMKDFNPEQWYEAARAWNEILEDQSMKFWVKLQPGRLLSMRISPLGLIPL